MRVKFHGAPMARPTRVAPMALATLVKVAPTRVVTVNNTKH